LRDFGGPELRTLVFPDLWRSGDSCFAIWRLPVFGVGSGARGARREGAGAWGARGAARHLLASKQASPGEQQFPSRIACAGRGAAGATTTLAPGDRAAWGILARNR